MTLFHQPLFNQRFLAKRIGTQPTPPAHKKLLVDWADTIRSGVIRKQKETELRGPFIQRFFVDMLGYRTFGNGSDWTINDEKRTGSGSADTALGIFSGTGKTVVAPVELKGADTADLNTIMPGRHKSPVQQVWEYAMDTPGCRFMLVSNMVEIRLYAVGYTRQVYERFEILELADSDAAYRRFQLLLSADNLLSGNTARLLQESAQAEKEITEKLYADYKTWRINLLISLMQTTEKPAEELIEPVQKLLDRVLFVAFAEDRGLLPAKTLSQAYSHRDPYNPRPAWGNFLGLFRAIDKGNPQLGIPAYNGGLFAPDSVLDALPVTSFRRRILTDLAHGGASAKLTKKLADWSELDFKTFHDEVKKQFKHTIPLVERDDWQTLFESTKAKVAALSAEITQHEKAVDQVVYELFELTNEEIALIETEVT